MNSLSKDSVFTLRSGFELTSTQNKMLLRCYLPLIGDDAYALYFLLLDMVEEKNDEYSNPTELREKMDGDLSKLNNGINLLEAMSLLSTYRLEKDKSNKVTYIYKLNPPLSPFDFFSNKEYLKALLDKIGGRRLKEISSSFQINRDIPSEFVDVSVTFSDMFQVDLSDPDLAEYNGEALKLKVKENKVNGHFNIEDFKKDIEELSIDFSIIEPQMEGIEGLANLYNVDAKTSAEIIKLRCISSSNVFSLDTFKNQIKNYYHFHVEDNNPELQVINIGTSDMAKRIKAANQYSPIAFLGMILQVDPPSQYRDILDKLHEDFKLQDPIINVLVDYVLQKCNGSLIENYIYKVAAGIPSHHFASANEALTFLMENENNRVEKKNKSRKSYEEAVKKAQESQSEEPKKSSDNPDDGDEGDSNFDLKSIMGEDL